MKTRAVVIDGYDGIQAVRVGEVAVPTPGPGEACVAVAAAAIGPWDPEGKAARGGDDAGFGHQADLRSCRPAAMSPPWRSGRVIHRDPSTTG